MKVVIYRRVSTEQQATSALGLEAQQAAINALCRSQKFEVVSDHTDEAVSGTAPLQARSALLEALASVKEHRAGALVVAKLDRLSRDLLIQLTVERELGRTNCRIISASGEGTATDNPSDRLVRNILSAVAENEAAVISARTKAALKAKRARGELLGGAPLGMKRLNQRAFIAADDFYLVAQILFLRFRKKMTYQAITDLMTEQHVRDFHLPLVWNTCKRWGKQPAFYKGAKTLGDLKDRDYSFVVMS